MIHLYRAIVFGLLLLHPFAAAGQTAPDRFDHLQSHWFARASGDALSNGERARAILLALRGIPADPTEADVASYPEAFTALWRAAASFAFQTEMDTLHIVHFSPSGHRALLFPAGEGLGTLSGQDPRLVSPGDGAVVAVLQELEGTYPFLFQAYDQSVSAFSSDNRLVAVSAIEAGVGEYGQRGSIRIFDATNGAALRSFPGDFFYGFSSDSRVVLSGDMIDNSLSIRDTQTGQLIAGPFSFTGVVTPFPGSDGAFYALENTNMDYGSDQGGLFLHRIDPGGMVTLADLTALAGQDQPGVPQPVASATTPYFALATPRGELAIIGLDGRISASGVPARASSAYEMAFVRGGEAVAVADLFGRSGPIHRNVQVFALDGSPLEPRLQDSAPFLDIIATPDGYRLGVSSGPRYFEAPEWPTGLALYERIWPQIPEALRTRIEAERITRSE